MGLPNVNAICYFAKEDQEYKNSSNEIVKVDRGQIIDFETCRTSYGFLPDGVNTYYGFSSKSIDDWRSAKANPLASPGEKAILGAPNNPFSHSAQVDRVLHALNNSGKNEMTFVFALQPEEKADPFNFMREPDSVDALTQLAKELDEKSKLAQAGKRLRIVIRFASEMNTRENKKWGVTNPAANPEDFIKAYKEVRRVFRSVSPFFLMAFSPALRVDLDPKAIKDFYPGIANIDFLSGTWYYGGTQTIDDAFDRLQSYYGTYKTVVLQRAARFALDEWGGTKPGHQFPKPLKRVGDNQVLSNENGPTGWESGQVHEEVLKEMGKRLKSLSTKSIVLDYVTLFMEKKWNPRQVLDLPWT